MNLISILGYNLNEKKYSMEELEDIIANDEIGSWDWVLISQRQTISEDFMERHINMIHWYSISTFQKLSETFIEKYSDEVDWKGISMHQSLSESFIERFSGMLEWDYIIMHQELSYEFLEKHLYKYSLYINGYFGCVNMEHIIRLRKRYSYKYQIDKLAYELSRE